MLKYAKSAFWEGIHFERLGRIPLNAIAFGSLMILGFGHPAFWLLGLGLEGAYLGLMATHPRYRRLVDARALPQAESDSFSRECAALEKRLDAASAARHTTLRERITRAGNLLKENAGEALLVDHNNQALRRFEWLHLKLLLARLHLQEPAAGEDESSLRNRVAGLEKELENASLSTSLRESKQATLEILRRRLEVFADRETTRQQIESDLQRIEAQVDLALESAMLQGPTTELPDRVDLASQLFSASFGDSAPLVSKIDHLLME